MDRTTQFLKDLVEAHGTPGSESEVAQVMQGYLKGIGPSRATGWAASSARRRARAMALA
jgi:putative aminopeptidase FrvX